MSGFLILVGIIISAMIVKRHKNWPAIGLLLFWVVEFFCNYSDLIVLPISDSLTSKLLFLISTLLLCISLIGFLQNWGGKTK